MLEELQALANEKDLPYRSRMKVYLPERLVRERRRNILAWRRTRDRDWRCSLPCVPSDDSGPHPPPACTSLLLGVQRGTRSISDTSL